MKLNKIQLEKIRIYLAEIGFKYVDVQAEILDHVASGVEDRMTENPDLSFQDAVNLTGISFGKNGFYTIEKSIITKIQKKYCRLFLSNFVAFLGLRHLWMVLLSIIVLYQLQNLIADQTIFSGIFVVSFLVLFIISFFFSRRASIYKKFIAYKISCTCSAYLGLFLMAGIDVIKAPIQDVLFGLNGNYLTVSILLTFFALYIAAAYKTEEDGINESRNIAEKLKMI